MERVSKTNAKKWLANVPAAYTFKSRDGRELKNLRELSEALQQMSDETFCFHSVAGRSDFSIWVDDIIGDARLAAQLAATGTRQQAASVTAARMAVLMKTAEKIKVR